eukprot:TRINITY_DN80572_c0_g1_i1.p1 TRINITY_DN80572_c0_g1~~TRINITY_DN80572_c0_g1_i1.p1  ORF type:complete len:179 (-),score=28.28 TRINITY_DN80572_c0_g1_i1:8-502(-)
MAVTLHTSMGDIKIELHCELVPRTSRNFLALCGSGVYNGCIFHRNVKQFIVQGGDPSGTGKGGESADGGYIADEFVELLKHDIRGVVAMANRGPNSNGSQFYITYKKAAHLDNVSTIFGRVIHGFDVLNRMESAAVDEKYRPTVPITIEKVTIHANPFAELEED